jgi:hypothetical protein
MIRKIMIFVFALFVTFPIASHAQIKMFKEPPFEFYKVSKGDWNE